MAENNKYEPIDLPIKIGEATYNSITDIYEFFSVTIPATDIFPTKEKYEYASTHDFQGIYRLKQVKSKNNRYCDFVYVENEIMDYEKDNLTLIPMKIQDDFFLKYMKLVEGELPTDATYYHEYIPYIPEHYKTGEEEMINMFGNLVWDACDYYVIGPDGNKYEVMNEVYEDGVDITAEILDDEIKSKPKLMKLMEKDNYQGVFQAYFAFSNGYLFEERYKVRLGDDGLYYFDELENYDYMSYFFLIWAEDDDGYPKQLCNVYKIEYIASKFITE